MNFDPNQPAVGKAEMQEHGGTTPHVATSKRGKRRLAKRNAHTETKK